MILVMPNAYTLYQGSMYSNSVTTGVWEDFVVRDLVSYVDSHYRTIPARESRGLAGHSMGGFGTIRLGMKFPEVCSSNYILSSCCLSPNPSVDIVAQDPGLVAMHEFDNVLTSCKILHKFDTYDGTHIRRIGERLETKVLPFFSSSLSFASKRH